MGWWPDAVVREPRTFLHISLSWRAAPCLQQPPPGATGDDSRDTSWLVALRGLHSSTGADLAWDEAWGWTRHTEAHRAGLQHREALCLHLHLSKRYVPIFSLH